MTDKVKKSIADADLFMMCPRLNTAALSELPIGYHIRRIHEDELDIWKRMPFDDEKAAGEYQHYMNGFFNRVYALKKDQFFERCLFVCDSDDSPVGTCFLWEAHGIIPTIHWFKVRKEYEGRGIGRALLSEVMKSVVEYPVYLHTQAGSFRAIKLYSDFGFYLLTDPLIGARTNEIEIGLPYLKEHMPEDECEKLRFHNAEDKFLRVIADNPGDEF